MRRFLTLYITPFIGILIVLLHIPKTEEWLSGINPEADIWIIIGLICLVIINHILTIYSPLKKYERLNKQKFFILNALLGQINRDYEQYGVTFNLMIPKRKWCFFEHRTNEKGNEESRFRIVDRVFDFVWRSKNSNINNQLRITVNQGIAGKVLNEGKAYVHNFTTSDEKFFFCRKQMEQTKTLKVLFSVPVKQDDSEYADKFTNEIIAVLNAESESEKSLELFNNDKLRNRLTEDLIKMTTICNKII